MRYLRSVLLAAAALLLAACASDDFGVSTTYDPLSPFPRQATYAWDERANSLPEDPRLEALDLDTLLREAADREFAGRGWRVTTGASDYRLSYQLRVHTWIGANNSVSQASLSLNLVETKAKRRVWTGFARANVHVGLERNERFERIRMVLERMLEDFPPAERGDD